MSGHTPGPWRACKDGSCSCGHVWSIPGDFPVCSALNEKNIAVAVAHEHMADDPETIYQSITPEMCAANARLIAAAPALLDAASNLIGDVRRRYPGEDLMCPYMRALDEAVTAAKQDKGGE